ncbi:PA domain-containing protein [Phaeodactylibacter luteus]|uniref:T9SS type A sorting domain-containing protein n=1 Tax=Phaeodactylibacter luteus TaxID=1564516 RepID=A0A5C6RG31_9BACT|nr:PA domain-containing protein [Phaeodactylibacter luteus]TXB61388.1 T9SS type A sorting domain-containing protein [Phaeodactylibacter luteus]
MKKTYLTKLLGMALMLLAATSFVQAQGTLTVDAPASVAGDYTVGRAGFGPRFGATVSAPVVTVTDTSGATTGCFMLDSGVADVAGAIALVDRGVCGFPVKALSAQAAGAVGVIICNNDVANPDAILNPGGDDGCQATIPTVFMSYNDCQAIRMEEGLMVTIVQDDLPPAGYVFETAIEITDGTYTIDSIPTFNNSFTNATGELWYKYTAAADGVLSISSCQDTAATRGIVTLHPGGCFGSLAIFDFGIANCTEGPGAGAGSDIQFLAFAGQEYYIVWDNALSADGFDFTVNLDPLPAVPVTFNVDMNNETVSSDGVSMVVGGPGVTDLNEVTLVAMADEDGDGIYSVTYDVTTLDTIGYAFLNGALEVANLESVPDSCGLPSGFGFNIRPLINNAIDAFELDAVCFSSCSACPLDEVTDCDDPLIFFADDTEGYTEGEVSSQSDWWSVWPGATVGGQVTTEQANSGAQSVKISGDIAGQDALVLLGDRTEGHFITTWQMYVPEGSNAYFNIQHPEATGNWALEVLMDNAGTGELSVYDGSGPYEFSYPEGEWFPVTTIIDIDNDVARMIIGRRTIATWTFSGGSAATSNMLGGINFYPLNATYTFYVDDLQYWQIPDAGVGQYCYTATEAAEGMNTVEDLSCFGGGVFYDTGDNSGLSARWFSYTATEDGYINISSCGAPADTRGYILGGPCDDLSILSANDDRCLMSTGDPYATLAEAPVTAGETYYIMWDSYWDDLGFDWELTFTAGDLPESNFCESAAAVEPGTYTTDSFGEAAIGKGLLGASTNSASAFFAPALYAGAAWYAYTPSEDQTIRINSCDSGEDTYVIVYTGECGNFSSLTLAGESDDDCIVSSDLTLDVTAGTTYYIEWLDLYEPASFDWELSVVQQVASVTFNVDVTLLVDAGELSGDGMFIAGSFSNFENVAMSDSDGDNIWTVTVDVPQNMMSTYKFKNGVDGWEGIDTSIGEDCTTGDFSDRFIEVAEEEMITLDPVCFGYCVACNIVDVDEQQLESGVSVFPNPASGVVNVKVQLAETASDLNIRLVNALGQVVLSRDLGQTQADMIELNVEGIAAGTYMLQVRDGQAQFTQSVVIK